MMNSSIAEQFEGQTEETEVNKIQSLKLSLYLVTEARLGSGLGIGTRVDQALARDRAGRPVLRWYGVKALIRNAAANHRKNLVGQGLISEVAEHDRCVLRLLGREGRGDGQGFLMGRSWSFIHKSLQLDSLLLTGITRNVNSRVSRDESLRIDEVVPAGAEATGEFRFYGTDKERAHLKSWIQKVTNIGGAKQRSSGRICVYKIEDSSRDAEITNTPIPIECESQCCFRVILENLEPLTLVDGTNSGNLMNTRFEINSGSFRASLLYEAGYLNRSTNGQACEDPDKIAESCRFGDAYVLPENFQSEVFENQISVIPCPASLLQQKETEVSSGANVSWWSNSNASPLAIKDALSSTDEDQELEITFKPIRDQRFLATINGSDFYLYSPATDMFMRNRVPSNRLHQTHDSRSNSPDQPETNSALFSQQVLLENQLFQTEVVCDDPDAAKQLFRLLSACKANDSWLRIGRGGNPVRVRHLNADSRSNDHDNELAAESLTIYLTSHCIIRSADLGFHTLLTPEALLDAGIIEQQDLKDLTLDREFSNTVQVSGYIGSIGKRRRAEIAIGSGSVFKYTGASTKKLRDAFVNYAHFGIGERTDEGFGRFKIDLFSNPVIHHASASNAKHSLCDNDKNAEIKRLDYEKNSGSSPHPESELAAIQAVDFLKRTPGLDKNNIPFGFPSKTQWETLLRRSFSQNNTKKLLGDLRTHSKKAAGADWKYPDEDGNSLADRLEKFAMENESMSKQLIVAVCRLVIGWIESRQE